MARVQDLTVRLSSLSYEGVSAEVRNARLDLPLSEPVVLTGSLEKGVMDFNIYSAGVDIHEVLAMTQEPKWQTLAGEVTRMDLFVSGTLREPRIEGEFTIKEAQYRGFSMTEAPGALDLTMRNAEKQPGIYGSIVFFQGTLRRPKTAAVHLAESRIMFSGPVPTHINLDLHAKARVDKVDIRITLEGTPQEPDLILTSQPPLPQEQLLIMVATNKRWKAAEEALEQKQLSLGVARDFLDYFVFGGSGDELARKLGVNDISFTLTGKTTGVEVKKKFTDKFEAAYGVGQTTGQAGAVSREQKIGGEYQITEDLSLEGEKSVKGKPEGDPLHTEKKSSEQIFLKYEKAF